MSSRSRFSALVSGLAFALALAFASLLAAPAGALVYTYDNTTSAAIPTSGTCATFLSRDFTVTDSFTVAEIGIGVNLSHNSRGHVRGILVSPTGTTLQVMASGGDTDNNYDIFISNMSDTGANLDDNDEDPVAEPYYNRLVDLDGITFYTGSSVGTWTLRLCDVTAGTTGTFNRAQLMLRSAAGTTTSCASRMTYDWASNGNNAVFTNTTISNVTLTQTATVDYGGAGFNNTTLPRYNFRTGTATFSSHAGNYGFYMDAVNQVGGGVDSETIMERASFTFSPPSRDLQFTLADNDWASGDFEDLMRVVGLDSNGVMVPYTVGNNAGAVNQLAGYWIEGDAASSETGGETTGNGNYRFEGPVATLHIDYGQGDEPVADAGDQWLFVQDFSFCAFDYGDAPATFGSVRHVLGTRPLYLGTVVPDGETADQTGSSANGDDSTTSPGVDDENGVTTFPTYTWPTTSYTVSANAVNLSTTTAAFLYGYIDWNRDGDFADAGERSDVTNIPANTSTSTAFNVTWSSVPVNAGGTTATYARFRIGYTNAEVQSPTGLANSGEVEDYVIPANTLPVTLAYFQSSARGIEFATASETASIGFRLLGGGKGGEVELGRLASRALDSQSPQHYRLDLPLPAGVRELWLEEIDPSGRTRRHGPFPPGQTIGAMPEEAAIDWNAIREELAAGEATRIDKAAPLSGTPFAGARIEVRKPGIQRITHAALLSAGIDLTGTAATQLALVDNGTPVARAIVGGPVWNASSAIEFLFAPKLTLASPFDVVELRLDPSKARAPQALAVPASGIPGAALLTRLEASPNKAYSYASPNGDPFFDQRILAFGSPAKLDRFFDLPDVLAGAARIELKMWGVTNFEGSEPDHHVVVRLNGNEVANARFDGLTEYKTLIDDPGALLATGNHLEIELPFDTGYAFDLVHFEGFTVTHRRAPVARGGLLEGTTTVKQPIAATGFATAASLWADGGRALLAPSGGKVYLPIMNGPFSLAEPAAQHQPVVRAGIPAKAAAIKGNYLIVSHPAFAGALGDLIALEEARGHQPAVVSTEAIWASFSDHAPDPKALQRYVQGLGRDVEYVLLVGGESYDPYDYLAKGSISFIPSFYQRVGEFVAFGPTDELVVDRDGDRVPDLPIGRLPVRTLAELQVMIDKMWAWQNSLAPRQALVSAGLSSPETKAELAAVNDSYRVALGKPWTTITAAVDESGTAAVRSSILDAFAQGMPLISYVGHSAFGQWDVTPVLRWQDVAGLGYGGRPSVVLQWGCWNGYYASPEFDTLSNHLLLQPTVGAVAAVGSSNLTSTAAHHGLGTRFLARVSGGERTVGKALLGAKRDLYAFDPNTMDAIWGQILLGDPATPLP
jgi:subtilisin-like proprotein convertase family protein